MIQLSVILPTYNRCKTLVKTLHALFAQEQIARDAWDVIVVNDGSTDETQAVVMDLKPQAPVPLTYLQQANSGPAKARNVGIRAASAPLVFIMGDDILASPTLLARHIAAHERYSQPGDAILGRVTWSPALTVTPFMRWWGENRFRFSELVQGIVKPDFTFFYTCNISVKRAFLLEHGLFDEDFRAAAYEDTELAHRLNQAGLHIHFEPEAGAYHEHPTDVLTACRRMETIGRWSLLFEAKTGFGSASPTWLRWGRFLLLVPRVMARLQTHAEQIQTAAFARSLYETLMMYHFWIGRRQGVPT